MRSRRPLIAAGGLLALVVVGVLVVLLTRGGGQDTPFTERRIASEPVVAAGSSEMVAKSLVPFVGTANLAISDDWAIPVVKASSDDPETKVELNPDGYGSKAPVSFRVPAWARPSMGDDHHLAVLDGGEELDSWVTTRQPDGSLKAGARVVLDGKPVGGPITATASGFALTAGLITPEEIAAGHIDHALAFTSPYIRAKTFVAPATHTDGTQGDPQAMPMGTKIQLDPAVDVSGLPRPTRVIARALQEYGAYLVDTGGSLAFRAESGLGRTRTGTKDIWTPVGVTDPSLRDLPWSRMRVLAPAA